MWHEVRKDLEDKLFAATGDESIRTGQAGTHKNDIFFGHCSDDGSSGYNQITGTKETFAKIPSLYGSASRETVLSFPAR